MTERPAQESASTATDSSSSLSTTRRRPGRGPVVGAIFLMATSAIGPGFITQTATFTATLGAAFAFAILLSILIDFAVQMNVWRLITVTGKRAGDLANSAVPFSGHVLTVLIVVGGLAFNIGNIAGGGLGLNALLGLDPKVGGLVTGLLAIAVFLFKRAGTVVDRVVLVLGVGMIVMTVAVAIASGPPVGDAFRQTFVPDTVNFATITTIVGGTVGGYITYAGAHRYLASGQTGPEHVRAVHRASVTGILVTGVMRYVLFLAVLGVVASGVALDLSGRAANPRARRSAPSSATRASASSGRSSGPRPSRRSSAPPTPPRRSSPRSPAGSPAGGRCSSRPSPSSSSRSSCTWSSARHRPHCSCSSAGSTG